MVEPSSLESIVAQTYRPIELIVVDDGSSDGTAEAVESWFQALEVERKAELELRLLRQPNGGCSRARNHGLAVARGEFIQFLDSDDLLHPRKLEVHVSRLQADAALAYVYSSVIIFTSVPDWSSQPEFGSRECMEIQHHIAQDTIHSWYGMYRRSTCLAIGPWNEDMRGWIDVEYNLRLLLTSIRIEFAPGVYVASRQHAGERDSEASAAADLEDLRVIAALVRKSGRAHARAFDALAAQCFRIGLNTARLGDRRDAREAARLGLHCARSWSRRLKLHALALLSARVVPDAGRRRMVRAVIGTWATLAPSLARTR